MKPSFKSRIVRAATADDPVLGDIRFVLGIQMQQADGEYGEEFLVDFGGRDVTELELAISEHLDYVRKARAGN